MFIARAYTILYFFKKNLFNKIQYYFKYTDIIQKVLITLKSFETSISLEIN